MTQPAALTPRAQALLTRIETWSDAGPGRAVAVKALVTLGGPLVILAGIAMLVLPGPGLVAIVLGFTLLALEYPWAQHVLARLMRGASWVRHLLLPRDASPLRRLTCLVATGAFLVSTTVLTGAITTWIGTQTLL